MKKGFTLALAFILSATMLSGCGASGASASKDSGTTAAAGQTAAADTKAQDGTSDDIFTWDGTVITGLTEKGKAAETLTIPDKATAIGENAFKNSSVAKVVWGANVEEIGAYAFKKCEKLTEISIPASVKKIDKYAFSYCQSLTSLTFSEGLTEIGNDAFEATSVPSITLPEGLTTIGESAFNPCPDTTAMYLPASLENIPGDALGFNFGTTLYVKEGSWADQHFSDYVPVDYITKDLSFTKANY